MKRRTLLSAAAGITAFSKGFAPSAASAQAPGVTADRIIFGQAAPLEGPAGALGAGMRQGINAAFAEINRAGGIRGRRLELVSRDDGYEPGRSLEVTRALLGEGIFGIIGPVGTPTSAAVLPVMQEGNVPFIGPFTGAEVLRTPFRAFVVNVRASYNQETETMVERLTKDLGAQRIAIMYQDDAFGRAGLDGTKAALERRGMQLVAEGTYERNTTAVRNAVIAIQRGRPDAIIMVGAPRPCAEFIKIARQVRMNVPFVNISFVGSEALAAELGDAGAGVIVTQVVPFPHDTSNPLARRYQEALRAADANARPGFISFEGYIVGRLAGAVIGNVQGDLTRTAFLDTLYRVGSYDIDGFPIRFGANSNQGSNQVFLTMIGANGQFRPIERFERQAG